VHYPLADKYYELCGGGRSKNALHVSFFSAVILLKASTMISFARKSSQRNFEVEVEIILMELMDRFSFFFNQDESISIFARHLFSFFLSVFQQRVVGRKYIIIVWFDLLWVAHLFVI
jgi:hypothetical protein